MSSVFFVFFDARRRFGLSSDCSSSEAAVFLARLRFGFSSVESVASFFLEARRRFGFSSSATAGSEITAGSSVALITGSVISGSETDAACSSATAGSEAFCSFALSSSSGSTTGPFMSFSSSSIEIGLKPSSRESFLQHCEFKISWMRASSSEAAAGSTTLCWFKMLSTSF